MNRAITERFKNALVWTISTTAVSLFLTIIMAEFEKGVNPNLEGWEDIIWWWVVTVAGVGYGDILPVTTPGRIFGGMVIISSLFLLAIVISEISALIKLVYEHRERGIIKVRYDNHIVIFGYTSLTAGVIKLLRMHYGSNVKIVLVSNEIQTNPFPSQVDFINSNPLIKTTFEDANAKYAAAAIILANDRFNDPDAYSLVILSELASRNIRVTTLVEVKDETFRELFKEKYVDGFITRKELLNDLLIKEAEDSKLIRVIDKETKIDDKAKEMGIKDKLR